MLGKFVKEVNLMLNLIFLAFILSGCAANLSVTGIATQPIPKDSVKTYLNSSPSCKYDEVGLLDVAGGSFSTDKLLDAFKEKAAQVGADGVIVSQIDKNGLGEYRGTAIAIRCK